MAFTGEVLDEPPVRRVPYVHGKHHVQAMLEILDGGLDFSWLKLTGVTLDDPETRFDLQLALKMYHVALSAAR